MTSKQPATNDQNGAQQSGFGPEYARYAGLGVQFAGTVCLLVLGGYWLDRKIETLPVFTALGALLGCVGGIISLVKKVPPPRGTPH